jgi:uncharacterized Tic20 family protein
MTTYRNRATEEEIRWAAIAHLSAVPAMLLGLGFVGPMLVGRMRAGSSPFVRHHVVQAVNFNVTVMLAGTAALLTMAFSPRLYDAPVEGAQAEPQYIPATALMALLLILIYWILFVVRAAMSARYGQAYRYPRSLPVMR